MAVSTAKELQAVAAVTARLQALLQAAKDIKTTPTVDPPLPLPELQAGIDDVLHDIDVKHELAYKFAAIETAARDIFYSIITSSSIGEPAFSEVWNLLDILLYAGDQGQCAPELVVWLIEELLDSQTTEGCRIVFDYLESRRDRLAQKDFHKKNLVFLRTCNELLRRLSRAEDATFCGRVFFFLFQTFPLGDKSSVNLRGEYHVENTTNFDESIPVVDIVKPAGSGLTAIAEPNEGSKTPTRPAGAPTRPGAKAVPARAPKKQPEEEVLDNTTLYPIFWRLQQAFSVPTKLFQPAEMQSFKAGLAATLTKFRKTPTVVQTANEQRVDVRRQQNEGHTPGEHDFSENYNPKYLTSRELFDLELTDQAFQRHILVQALILLNFLLSLTEQAKAKLTELKATNKSVLYDFVLSPEDTTWALAMKESIRAFITPLQEGRFYDRMVDTILSRDKNWVRWKIEGCPAIVRGAVSADEILQAQDVMQRTTKPRRVDTQVMAAMDLEFLADDETGGLNTLRDAERYTGPTTEMLVNGIETDRLDLDFASGEEAESLENMVQNKTWRLVRTAGSSHLELLSEYDAETDATALFKRKTATSEATAVVEAAAV